MSGEEVEAVPKNKANAPPEVITVDTAKDAGSETTPTKGDSASQARTPKHANKQSKDGSNNAPERIASHAQRNIAANHGSWNNSGPPPPVYQSSSYPPPPHIFEHPRGGAFQPAHDRHSYPLGQAPMQISPGGGRYYFNGSGRFSSSNSAPYDHRYSADFSQGPNYPQQQRYGGGPPPLYPQQQQQFSGYDGGVRAPASWGPPPSFPHGRPPAMHHHHHHHAEQQLFGRTGVPSMMNNDRNNANFSRAVSSSFDRSIKSGHEKGSSSHIELHSPKIISVAQHAPDTGSVSEDASWGALKQVHSVDEDEMRKRLKRKGAREKDVIVNEPASNSSSLTNSPTDGVEGKEKKLQKTDKTTGKPSSLDSLSSVASAQEPIDTKCDAASKTTSPDGSTPSLDLMKCPSGTSALLLPSHQRSLSQLSLSMLSKATTVKREDDEDDNEERDGIEHDEKVAGAHKSDGGPEYRKKSKSEKKSSPLSITCSPPGSPDGTKKKDAKMHQPQARYPRKEETSPAFYDKAPSYTYSMESGPPGHARPDSYPTVPRPGSSASSTITPMNVDGVDNMRHPPGVGQIPSWEIHAQDSFGATSASGNQLMGSFSFQQEYQMLAPSASGEHPMQQHPNQTLESRNQSFEGGHYHGGFGRTDSMMSYEGRQLSFDGHGRSSYQGPFPPHASSWGSASSYPASYVQQHQRMGGGYQQMMRNYSEDSGARTSPPPPPSNMRMIPPNFPPPPEFHAPPSMVSKGGPQNTIMTSSYPSSPKGGPFGWNKEEDSRLTEIMKKYKNPRDWEPIAKEHNRRRSAKECHERWIRYLKPGVRKGQWTDHEDAVVMDVVTTSSEQPFTRWSDLAQRLPGRVGKQIRDRWVNHLNPAINHLPFSREDDLNLWEGHKELGKRWVEISTKNFNNTRSENHIKNRWYSASFKKFISNEFGAEAYVGGKSSESEDGGSPKKDSPSKKKLRRQQTIDPSQMESV